MLSVQSSSIEKYGNRPLILVPNDDGIFSPGLLAAAQAASSLGDVLVAAPKNQQTAMGRSYPKVDGVGRIEEVELAERIPNLIGAYSVEGAPAQVVSYAVLELVTRLPNLCISGVNFGENLGSTLTGSGTLGAAFEADSYSIPSIAISLQIDDEDTPESVDWAVSQFVCEQFGLAVLDGQLPSDVTVLNINVPRNATRESQIARTVDSRQPFWVFRKPNRTELSNPARLKVETELILETLESQSDIHALIQEQKISVTPINKHLAYVGPWQLELFS